MKKKLFNELVKSVKEGAELLKLPSYRQLMYQGCSFSSDGQTQLIESKGEVYVCEKRGDEWVVIGVKND